MLACENLIERYGVPFYLKIDIDGCDFVVLQRLALIAARPRYISVENGWPYILDHLVGMGYSGFKFINQAEVPKMPCPSPAKEGNDVPWTFPFSASSPFGEDMPEEWKSSEEVLVDIKVYWNNPQIDANVHCPWEV